jgi:hypothetical protein
VGLPAAGIGDAVWIGPVTGRGEDVAFAEVGPGAPLIASRRATSRIVIDQGHSLSTMRKRGEKAGILC